jgi:hypothetical protein
MIRKWFKSVPFLYVIWLKYLRKTKLTIPSNEDVFYFDGYPRSGNSYLTNLFKNIFPTAKFSHHLYCVASLKIAIKNKIPAIIIVREPLESISSLIVMDNPSLVLDDKTVARYVDDFIDYFQYLKMKLDIINIISFESTIKNPELFFLCLEQAVPNLKITKKDYDLVSEFVDNKLVEKKQSSMSNDHAVRFSSTPNQERTAKKEKVKTFLINNRNLQKAQRLFEEVVSRQFKS